VFVEFAAASFQGRRKPEPGIHTLIHRSCLGLWIPGSVLRTAPE
jgi:hypothetical protein